MTFFQNDLISLVGLCSAAPEKLDHFTPIDIDIYIFVGSHLFPDPTIRRDEFTDINYQKTFWRHKQVEIGTPTSWFIAMLRNFDIHPSASEDRDVVARKAITKPLPENLLPLPDEEEDMSPPPQAQEDPEPVAADLDARIDADIEVEQSVQEDRAPHSSSSSARANQQVLGLDTSDLSAEQARMLRFQVDSLYESAQREYQLLELAEQPPSLKCVLRPYQRQALTWLCNRERVGDSKSLDTVVKRHPLWDEYEFLDKERTKFYVNPFSKEISLVFPRASPSCRGG